MTTINPNTVNPTTGIIRHFLAGPIGFRINHVPMYIVFAAVTLTMMGLKKYVSSYWPPRESENIIDYSAMCMVISNNGPILLRNGRWIILKRRSFTAG